MTKSIIVFGGGRFGTALTKDLFEHDVEVVLVDKDFDVIQSMANFSTAAIQADIEDEQAMNELGLSNFDMAIVAIGGNLDASIMAVLAAKDAGIPRIIAKAASSIQSRILDKLGADQIIYPEIDMGVRLARSLSGQNILEFIHFSDEYSLIETRTLKKWIGQSIKDIDFRNTYNFNIVAIKRNGQTIVSPTADEIIKEDDTLVIIGEDQYLYKIK